MATYTDATFVERQVKGALAFGQTTPDLSQDDIDDLLTIAQQDGAWETSRLDAVIAQGWMRKAGLVANRYDLGGGTGLYLKQSQWWDHCTAMAASYRSGAASVDPDGITNGDGESEILTVRGHFLAGNVLGEWS